MSELESFIDAVAQQDFNQANSVFNDMIGQRMSDALDQEKIAVAGQIFNNEEPEELEASEDEDAEDFTDEEIEEIDAAIDDLEDDGEDEEDDIEDDDVEEDDVEDEE